MRSPFKRFREWNARRIRAFEEGMPIVRDEATRLVERMIQPYVNRGQATLTRDDSSNIRELAVVPTKPGAAELTLWLAPDYHDLSVGPRGNVHEILSREQDPWQQELENCIAAICEGRYTERISEDGKRLVMRFGVPGGTDVEVHHTNMVVEAGENPYGTPDLHRYAPYADTD